MSKSRKCCFKTEWLTDPDFMGWLKQCDDKHGAFCTLCKKNIDIGNMGVSALKSHLKAVKHTKLCQAMHTTKPVQSYFSSGSCETKTSPASSSVVLEAPSTSFATAPNPTTIKVTSTPPQSLREKSLASEAVLKSEIIWALNVATKHMSFNSCTDINNIFMEMFPDSEIAKSFSCAPTKCSYLLCFGIAKYFKEKLNGRILKCEFFSLCFDGSVNRVIQKDQVDIIIRFWDEVEQKVISRFIGAQFLGHAKADNLVKALHDSMEEVDSSKLIQIGMDGPNVNHKTLKNLIEKRTNMSPEYPQLIDLGSCSIHTIHRSFEIGACETNWDLASLLRALWQIFKDSPARRSDFSTVNKSGLMPLKFCSTRWVEDVVVSERAVDIWPFIIKFVELYKDKPRSETASKSFQLIKEACKDNLVVAKLNFFSFVGKQVQPYLKCYQTDEPLIPFQAEDVLKLLYSLMSLFVKKDILDKSTTDLTLSSIDLNTQENLLFSDKIETGFAVREILSKLLKEKKINEKQVSVFKLECLKFLKVLVKKIQDKSPLKYPIVRLSRCLAPKVMAENKSEAIDIFTKLLQELQKRRIITSENCDSALSQFKVLLSECPATELNKFSRSKDRLDTFYHDLFGTKKQYGDLWKVVKLILTLSHGQATIERGFSVNREVLVENIKEETLIALRFVCDELKNVKIQDVPMTKELLSYARSARMRYQNYLDDQKQKKSEEEKAKKRSAKTEKLKKLKKRKLDLENAIQTMNKEANEMAIKAENKKDFTLLAKSNSFRLKTAQMTADVDKINNEMLELSKEC